MLTNLFWFHSLKVLWHLQIHYKQHYYKQQFARRLNIRKMSTFSKFTKWNPPLKINKLNSTIFLTILTLSTLFWFSLSFDFTLFSTVTNLQHHHNYTIAKTKSGHHFSLSHIFLFNWKINTRSFYFIFSSKIFNIVLEGE